MIPQNMYNSPSLGSRRYNKHSNVIKKRTLAESSTSLERCYLGYVPTPLSKLNSATCLEYPTLHTFEMSQRSNFTLPNVLSAMTLRTTS